MPDFLIAALLIGFPIWAVAWAFRLRGDIDQQGRSTDSLTGAVFIATMS